MRVIYIRIACGGLWLAVFVWAQTQRFTDAPRVIPIICGYLVAAVVIAFVARSWPRALRLSWFALPLFDLPAIFTAYYVGVPVAPNPGFYVGASVASLLLVVIV